MKATPDLDHATTAERRQRLREAVAKMATAIDTGECDPPTRAELEAVAALCTEYFLPVELARVRRWMAP
jgi:hypothetical protein